jgi:hypothetical protein
VSSVHTGRPWLVSREGTTKWASLPGGNGKGRETIYTQRTGYAKKHEMWW